MVSVKQSNQHAVEGGEEEEEDEEHRFNVVWLKMPTSTEET